MQHTNLLAAFKLWASQSTKRQFPAANMWRITTVLSLLTVAIVSLTLGSHVLSTARAQEAAQTPNTASQFEASATTGSPKKESIEQSDVKTSIDNPITLGGTGCGWTSSATYPVTIRDNAVVGVGNTLYSFGGANSAFLANSYKFDGTTWTPIAPLPAAILKASAVTDGTSAYVVNGIVVGATANSVNTLYRYNPSTNDYTTLAPSPTGTWTQPAVFLNGKIYKIGGFNTVSGTSTASSAVEIYDIASNTWSTGANYPLGIAWAAAWAQGNFVYVAGGTGLAAGSESLKTYRYDPTANTWDDAAIADLPAPRWGAAFASYNGKLIVAGGTVSGTVSDTVIQWNSSTNAWTSLPNLLQPRQRVSGGVAGGAFYVVGGSTGADAFTGTNDNQKLFCPPLTDPFITGTVTYVSENGTPANNTPDPGETVTVSLNLQNVGGANSGNVTATLQATGGIVPVTTSQTYGVITAGGAAVSRNFTFTVPANAVCGSQITLTFTVTDGTTTTTVTQTYTLGTTQTGAGQTFSNTAAITINDNAPATPYPSTITVSGITGFTSTIRVELDGFNHTFPSDVDVLLVGPAGQKMVIMSDVGGGTGVTNVNITLDDAATAAIPTPITTGSYKPTNVDTSDTFPAPAPSGPYANPAPAGTATFASTFGGSNPNGVWSLYVVDDANLDSGSFSGGWKITVVPGANVCSTVNTSPTNTRLDFDGDGKTDLSVFRSGTWYVQKSSGGFSYVQWGAAGDQLVPADYDGDGKTDYAVFRPTATVGATDFYVLNSATNTFNGSEWGIPGDVAKPGNFTDDNKADFAVYRPSNNTWYIQQYNGASAIVTSIAGTTNAGLPIVLDYDGDGKADIAQVNNGAWSIRRSTDGIVVNVTFGQAGDRFVPADYDNDNKDDLAVFRDGQWIALKSSTNTVIYISFGQAGDIPVPGDYDGDGADDQAVYRDGVWYINKSSGGVTITTFGTATDIAVPSVYIQ